MTPYIPILTFFANTAVGVSESSKTAVTETNAGFMAPPYIDLCCAQPGAKVNCDGDATDPLPYFPLFAR
jgi:hypothetical protein